jgi:hypothetical protein
MNCLSHGGGVLKLLTIALEPPSPPHTHTHINVVLMFEHVFAKQNFPQSKSQAFILILPLAVQMSSNTKDSGPDKHNDPPGHGSPDPGMPWSSLHGTV